MSWRAELPAWLRIRFLDDLAIEAMLERLDGFEDPRVQLFDVGPLPSYEVAGDFRVEELADAALELLDVASRLARRGVVAWTECAQPVRTEEGVSIRVPAPGPIGLHLGASNRVFPARCVLEWFELATRFEPSGLALYTTLAESGGRADRALERLAAVASLKGRARARRMDAPFEGCVHVPIDPDLAVARGRAAVAAFDHEGDAVDEAWKRRRESERQYLTLPLASVLHRRAILAGPGAPEALADLAEAIGLDPCAVYLTTRALFAERRGDLEAAVRDHDAAVAALSREPVPGGASPLRPEECARTLHARGVFRARRGDLGGAEADLLAAIARRGTSALWEELAKVRRLRGDARGAEEAAREAQRMKEARPGRDR